MTVVLHSQTNEQGYSHFKFDHPILFASAYPLQTSVTDNFLTVFGEKNQLYTLTVTLNTDIHYPGGVRQ